MAVLTYSPSDVKIVISGYTLTGVNSVTLSWNTATFTIRRGIRGNHTRVFNRDLSARLNIEVLQTSVTNDVLFQILTQDRTKKTARIDLVLADVSGRSLLQSQEAYVSAIPEIAYSNGFNTRMWSIEILNLTDGALTGAGAQSSDLLSSSFGTDLLNNITGLATDAGDAIGGLL